MKKTVFTIAIILGLGLGAFAQGGGLFGKGPDPQSERSNTRENGNGGLINLPGAHNQTSDSDATTPIGGGALLLIGFGAAYALKKKDEK